MGGLRGDGGERMEEVKMEESRETMRAEPNIGPPSTATALAVEDGIEKVKVELKSQNS